jgi:nucleotide-binding universal stress UspA family protein
VSLPSKIVVAVDGSAESLAAARYAFEFANMIKAEIVVLYVIHLPQYISAEVSARLNAELTARGQSALSEVRRAVEAKGVVASEKLLSTTRSVVDTICEFSSSERAGMIVMGTRGEGLARTVLGSVASGVVRHAGCSVLVVRP